MSEKLIEAMERRKERDRVKMRGKRKAKADAKRAVAGTAPIVTSMNRKWRIGPNPPEMSKSELRAMFAEAARNTK